MKALGGNNAPSAAVQRRADDAENKTSDSSPAAKYGKSDAPQTQSAEQTPHAPNVLEGIIERHERISNRIRRGR